MVKEWEHVKGAIHWFYHCLLWLVWENGITWVRPVASINFTKVMFLVLILEIFFCLNNLETHTHTQFTYGVFQGCHDLFFLRLFFARWERRTARWERRKTRRESSQVRFEPWTSASRHKPVSICAPALPTEPTQPRVVTSLILNKINK